MTGRYLVDVSDLVVMDLRTGIQRVVREIVSHGVAGAAPVPVVPVIAVGNRLHPLSDAGWQRMVADGSGLKEKRITHEQGVPPLIRLGKKIARVNTALYNALQRLWVRRTIKKRAAGFYLPESINTNVDDRFILLDSFWSGGFALEAAEYACRAGTQVTLVVYDLIPITDPQFCDVGLVAKFEPLMRTAAIIADQVLAISQFSANVFNTKFGTDRAIPFKLGHDLRVSESQAAISEQWPEKLWQCAGKVFVIVGSIEPRKGHEAVLDAFEQRWASGYSDNLLIIGKVGWNVDALMKRIETHPRRGQQLFHIYDASDDLLQKALRHADASIIASFIEGFGLPLIEALAADTPVIAADIPVFREIGGEFVTYFAPGSPTSLTAAIETIHEQYVDKAAKAKAFQWPTWQQAAEQFYAQVAEFSARPRRT